MTWPANTSLYGGRHRHHRLPAAAAAYGTLRPAGRRRRICPN